MPWGEGRKLVFSQWSIVHSQWLKTMIYGPWTMDY